MKDVVSHAVISQDPLIIKQIAYADGQWTLQNMAPPTYVLQGTNTFGGSWTNLKETRSYIGGDLRIYEPVLDASKKFYRLAVSE